jgi:nucleotide-binding universal stress UspA family protein
MGFTMKLILVATDGSETADRAVEYAANLAKRYDASLLIVNVIGGYGLPDSVFRLFTHAQQAWLQELLESMSAQMLTKARDRARGLGVTTIQLESRTGDVAQTIVEIAEEKDADAIVVGKRGEGRVAGLLLGSISQKLVSLSPRPVTVVP